MNTSKTAVAVVIALISGIAAAAPVSSVCPTPSATAICPGPTAAPEMDPASAMSGLTLLLGGLVLLRGRKFRR